MVTVTDVAAALDQLFGVEDIEQDPAMSHFVPAVYSASGINWRNYVTPEFANRFNGLMVRGDEQVGASLRRRLPFGGGARYLASTGQPR